MRRSGLIRRNKSPEHSQKVVIVKSTYLTVKYEKEEEEKHGSQVSFQETWDLCLAMSMTLLHGYGDPCPI